MTEELDLPGEVWAKAATTNRVYDVSNMGRVRNRETGRVLKTGDWYKPGTVTAYLRLERGVRRFSHIYVAQLVAKAFLPSDPDGKRCVEFINGNSQDCRAENLRWTMRKQSKPVGPEVQAEVQRLRAEKKGLTEIARTVGLTVSGVSRLLKRLEKQKEAA